MNAFEAEFEADEHDFFINSRGSTEGFAARLVDDEAPTAVVQENDTGSPYQPHTILNQPSTTTNGMEAIDHATTQYRSTINSRTSNIHANGLPNGMLSTDSVPSAEYIKHMWSIQENLMAHLREYEAQQLAQGHNALGGPLMRPFANTQLAATMTNAQTLRPALENMPAICKGLNYRHDELVTERDVRPYVFDPVYGMRMVRFQSSRHPFFSRMPSHCPYQMQSSLL